MPNTMVHEVFAETVRRHGDRPALRVKRDGAWQTTTWKAYLASVRTVARALVALGVGPGQGVAIVGANSPEWLIADVAAIFAGGFPAGIYGTSSPEQARYIAAHCEARVAFADTPAQVEKLVAEQENLPLLTTIVQTAGAPASASRAGLAILSWKELLARAAETTEEALDARLAAQQPDDTCTLIYTSGTTGEPKAVMITHRNLTWTTAAALSPIEYTADDVTLSYLPLSHIAEQILSIHGPMYVGSLLYFVENLDKLADTLREVRPTMFVGVPRVWEKIQAKMMAVGAAAPTVVRKLSAWARKTGLAAGYAEQRGKAKPFLYPLAKKLVHDKVRQRLGLDRARLCVTSAAPIGKGTLEFFLSLGIPVLEVYGMSESTGPATSSLPVDYRTTTCGMVLPGTEIKIAEDGEICMRGPHVFKGYLKDPEATRHAIDDEGWLHSGDIGVLEDGKYLRITDRKKDLLITAGGENIAPQILEGRLKSIPVIGQAVVVGDRKKYLAALVTLDPERVQSEAAAAGSPASTVQEAAECAIFRVHLQKQIDELNEKLARVQTIKKFTVVPREFTIDGGELTPTMKLKRKVVNEKYRSEIDALYVET